MKAVELIKYFRPKEDEDIDDTKNPHFRILR